VTYQFTKPGGRSRILHLLFAASGAAALIYQILWLRAFSSVFGATAEAASAILAAFFLGLAFGSDFFGRVADKTARPLRLYALLELGIAVCALLALAALAAYRALYDELYRLLAEAPFLFTLAKLVLTGVALFPATALMGGTLPALGRALVGDAGPLGQRGSRLYAVNIIGAVAGALLATFGLALWLGNRGAYVLAVCLSLLIAGLSGWLAREESPQPAAAPAPSPQAVTSRSLSSERLLVLAFGSGFATIALQVLWTRMLALSLQNSVYSFGSVVAVFLAGLGLGALLVSRLLKRYGAWRILRVGLLATAALVLLTPAVFELVSGRIAEAGAQAGLLSHSLSVVGLVAAVILAPVITSGMTLPCIWELWRGRPGCGSRLGRPTAVNTLGAIVGPITAGFVLLPSLGLGTSIAVLGLLYILMGEIAAPRAERPRRGGWESAAVYPALVLILLFSSPTRLQVVKVGAGERLVWHEEGARGAVAVIDREGDWRIKLDNHYAIGGSRVVVEERRQGHLPILIHPDPKRVALIGMGTGITAGAALVHPEVERVVTMEIVPEIIEAARTYFRRWNAGILEDPRAEVVLEDGRNHLAGTDETFDVIIGDLFVPWREGVGSLYTREHFLKVAERLRRGGVFAQWLPLWQLSEREFEIVAATFLSVFDRVTLWRGVFSPFGASVALVAHTDGRKVDLDALAARLDRLRESDPFADGFLGEVTGFMLLYAGDLTVREGRYERTPLNSDDRPRIEWLAPRTLLAVQRGEVRWYTGEDLADLYDDINGARTLPGDSLFQWSGREPRIYRLAGARFYRAEVAAAAGEPERANELRRQAYQILETGGVP
jgi:spermidine synthase